MLSRNQQKLLRKLQLRKHRWQQQLFVAEGRKVVQDLLDSGLKYHFLVTTDNQRWPQAELLDHEDFQQFSQLEQADEIMGVFHFPHLEEPASGLRLILDEIRDPGNLGTIIRTADWYGVEEIYAVEGSVDAYNAKCVQSSMGSIARLKICYHSREEILSKIPHDHHLYVADMNGQSVYGQSAQQESWLVMGSESHGPSEFWMGHAQALTIPRKGRQAESLNVAIATAIMLDRLTP